MLNFPNFSAASSLLKFILGSSSHVIVRIRGFPKAGALLNQHRLLQGALLIVGAELMFACMGASIRLVSTDLNNGVVVFARNLVGLLRLSLVAHPHHRKLRTRCRICTFCAVRRALEPCTAFSMPRCWSGAVCRARPPLRPTRVRIGTL